MLLDFVHTGPSPVLYLTSSLKSGLVSIMMSTNLPPYLNSEKRYDMFLKEIAKYKEDVTVLDVADWSYMIIALKANHQGLEAARRMEKWW